MLSRPRFRPHFHVEVVPGEGVLVLSDSRQDLLRGRLYELVATAIGLAARAIGGGDSNLFVRAASTDYRTETSVGEFLLGSQRPGPVNPVR